MKTTNGKGADMTGIELFSIHYTDDDGIERETVPMNEDDARHYWHGMKSPAFRADVSIVKVREGMTYAAFKALG